MAEVIFQVNARNNGHNDIPAVLGVDQDLIRVVIWLRDNKIS